VASFTVDRCFYHPVGDHLVLAGRLESGQASPGMQIDLPQELRGPGWVTVTDVQWVPFRGGARQLCLILPYAALSEHPFLEFSDLEGKALDVRWRA
jgi:hypothetical protein